MIKLVMTDLDDTLVAAGNPRASDYALEAIKACIDAGVRVGPATGRIPSDLGWMFDNKDWAYQTSATCNGMILHLDGKHVKTVDLDREDMQRAVEVIRDFEGSMLVLHQDGELYGVSKTPWVPQNRAIASKKNQRMHLIDELLDVLLVKANVYVKGERDVCSRLKDALTEACPKLGFVFPNPKVPLIDIVPAGWGKGEGIALLCQEMGIEKDEVAVFGDSENDLNMMEGFTHSVAVANAMPIVAQTARWHIGASADEAVADALFEIAAAYKEKRMPSFMQD